MDIYCRYDDCGQPIFHVLYLREEDEYGTEKMVLKSSLPMELLQECNPNIVRLFEKQSRHLDEISNRKELIGMLGEAVEANRTAEQFYYPSQILFGNAITDITLERIIKWQGKPFVTPESVYSLSSKKVHYFVLRNKFLRFWNYDRAVFIRDMFPISKEEFEIQINTLESAAQYSPYADTYTNFYFRTTTIQGYQMFILCSFDLTPLLFVVKD